MSDAAFTRADLEAAMELVHRHMAPTPLIAWPLLAEATGAEVWVKHENHTPAGAFKIRGGITYVDWLRRTAPEVSGLVSATRGNHGQSIARAARAAGLSTRVYMPHGNSPEKNAAMRAFGAELVEAGADFDAARAAAAEAAAREGLHFVPSFHRELVRGVATYATEMFLAQPDIETVYVPIGLGSGICGVIAARDALGARADVVGVVSDRADGAARSVAAGQVVATESADTFADGMAVRVPDAKALGVYARGAARIVSVSDEAIADAMRLFHTATHNMAEGAGAAALAALMAERDRQKGRRVAVILCGGNVDSDIYGQVLAGKTPRPLD